MITDDDEDSEENQKPEQTDNVELRVRKDCLFADDLSDILTRASSPLTSRGLIFEKDMPELVRSSIRAGQLLIWTESAKVDQETYKKWQGSGSALKKGLFSMISTECGKFVLALLEQQKATREERSAAECSAPILMTELMAFANQAGQPLKFQQRVRRSHQECPQS